MCNPCLRYFPLDLTKLTAAVTDVGSAFSVGMSLVVGVN